MVDKSGKIDSVAIAVGASLGMGEHDVAVKFSELKWVDEPVSSTSSSSSSNARPGGSTATTGTNTTSSKRNYPDHAMLNGHQGPAQGHAAVRLQQITRGRLRRDLMKARRAAGLSLCLVRSEDRAEQLSPPRGWP